MARSNPAGRAERLREQIAYHRKRYYVDDDPEISDAEYDRLFRRLQALEDAFPELATTDSPTQRVGAEPQDSFETVNHVAPMLSLDSSEKEEALRRFDERIGRDR